MPIETMPATLKIIEKARKYHFSLSQSTFTPRNNSTGSLRFLETLKTTTAASVLVFFRRERSARDQLFPNP
jgi:hypothetical protein